MFPLSKLKSYFYTREISIEVAFALPSKQLLLHLAVEKGATVEQTIIASGILKRFPEIDLQKHKVGIWNRTCKLSDEPKDGLDGKDRDHTRWQAEQPYWPRR